MSTQCQTIAPSQQSLTSWQKVGLEVVSFLHGQGRDVVLAIDLTESVGLDNEGRIRLRQIIEDSLQKGDSVYVVPFATTINPLKPEINPVSQDTAITFQGKEKNIEQILQAVPLQSDLTQSSTDIQLAELAVYQNLAQLNQCRLVHNQPIKPQSIVWLTDAPLLTQAGITSEVWIETPAHSPFRDENSLPSQQRKAWLNTLPLHERSQTIDRYQLTVVDIPPSLQEFCTPAPGSRETCLVTPYLMQQLWLPASIFLFLAASIMALGIKRIANLISLKKIWELKVTAEAESEEQICFLRHQQSLSIGDEIECPGSEVRGYLKREGRQLYLEPGFQALPIYYQGREVTKRQPIKESCIRLNCPYHSRDFNLTIQINNR